MVVKVVKNPFTDKNIKTDGRAYKRVKKLRELRKNNTDRTKITNPVSGREVLLYGNAHNKYIYNNISLNKENEYVKKIEKNKFVSNIKNLLNNEKHRQELSEYKTSLLHKILYDDLDLLKINDGVRIPKPRSINWIDVVEILVGLITENTYGIIKVNNEVGPATYYTITLRNYQHLINNLRNEDQYERAEEGKGSDLGIYEYLVNHAVNEIFFKLEKRADIVNKFKINKKIFRLKKGRFFKYYHNLSIDLSKFQIYRKDQECDDTPCLIYALAQSGQLTTTEINKIESLVKVDFISVKIINKICKILKIKITLSQGGNIQVVTYGEEYTKHIKICLMDEHYFINNDTNITIYALENYDELKDIKNFNQITGINNKGYYKRFNDRYISIMRCVNYLLENKEKHLERIIDTGLNIKHKKKQIKEINLDYHESDVKLIEYREKEDINTEDNHLIFFDFETTTEGSQHIPYMVNAQKYEGGTLKLLDEKTFKGKLCALEFLKWINNDSIILAHNLKYDFQFIFKHLFADNLIEKNNRIMGGSCMFKNIISGKNYKIFLRDTYLMISEKLKNFSPMFLSKEDQLKIKKEVMPYSIYTNDTVNKDKYNYQKAYDSLKTIEDKKQFENNVYEWKLMNKDETFDHLKYAEIYCKQDVELMKTGYFKFREWMNEITGLDIINYLTISAIAYDYIIKRGCFNGAYSLSCDVRLFIQKCIVGGRCMISNNEKEIVNHVIADFDAVSLYPSAMYRMGFLNGKPIVLENLDYSYVSTLDGYFVKINITSINKERRFPLISRVDEITKTRQFRNDLLGIHYVDKVTLEDWIKFQEIEFEIIEGYGFNSGRNYLIQEVIKELFEERKKQKKLKNNIEKVYKLLMNSCYGKTILKDETCELKYITGESRAVEYIRRNVDTVVEYNEIDGTEKYKYRIKQLKEIDELHTSPHHGVEILSMSKRIMNEVMIMAEDMNINIYYQDTDSMHIENEGIKKLSDEFNKIYGRELIGKDMGQFHNDFDFKHDENDEPMAIQSIFCGKKSYIDKVKCIREGKEEFEYQIRLKGIPRYSIDQIVNKNYDGDYMKLYNDMYNGKSITFDLLASGVKFKFNKNYTVENMTEFKRTIKF